MLTFGFLTLNYQLEQTYFTEIARHATTHDMEVFCFSPSDIDPMTEKVDGLKYNEELDCWEKAIFPIPNFLYDRCFYPSAKLRNKWAPIVNWLKNRRNTTFIGYGLPNKWELYKALSNHSTLKYYVPETIKATHPNDIVSFLKQHTKILLKPINGAQGKGILSLALIDKGIELQIQLKEKMTKKVFTTQVELSNWLVQLLAHHSYLVQPFLSIQDDDHQPFDLRVFVQKDKHNHWCEIGRGIRKGCKNQIISNLSNGATVQNYYQWIKQFDTNKKTLLKDELHTIISHIPLALEQNFGPLFEIGIDIGIAQDGTIWILDTNSKPGHKTILQIDETLKNTLYEAPLLYCKHLALQRS